jgi:protease I
MNTLEGMKVAVLVTDGFEQSELVEPRRALRDAGARSMIVSPRKPEVQGWIHFDKGDRFKVDVSLDAARSEDFDALVLPGGVANPDQLRTQARAIEFVRGFVEAGKPIAAICHGPWTLIDADGVSGHRMTSWPSLRRDLVNAGAEWVDREVVVDDVLVSSRKPDDLPAFTRAMVETFARWRRAPQARSASRKPQPERRGHLH